MDVVKLVFSEEKATKGLNLVSSKRKAEHVELTNAIESREKSQEEG